jgi:branched-chain amino acid transport system permease protein
VSDLVARLRGSRRLRGAALWAVLLALPLYLESFWLQSGLFAMVAIIGAIGLTLLVGTGGQLSLAHAFFLAVGAYGYCFLAGDSSSIGTQSTTGLGLPPVVAMAGAGLLAGLAGALFSPIAGRLRGIYLGVASLGLVFIGQHILFNAGGVTGGFNGRDAGVFDLFGFSFGDDDPSLSVLGVDFGGLERLWYLGLALVGLAYWFARNLTRGRQGRALEGVRDSEVAAASMGVDVARHKAAIFTISSVYAGVAGALYALVFERVVPETFGLGLSLDYLVMIVLGGLGSIPGAAAGAVIVTLLPQFLTHYSESLPLLSEPGAGDGLTPPQAARLLYGAAIVAVLLFAPSGLAGLRRRRRARRSPTVPPTPQYKERSA